MATTKEIVLAMATEHPLASLAELGRCAGVSRERARQIIQAAGIIRTRAPRSSPSPAKEVRRVGRPRRQPQPPLRTGGVNVEISSRACGAVGELLAAADLIARGWSVFVPLVHNPTCDLLALSPDGDKAERIEVRSGRRSADGQRIIYPMPDRSLSDRRAIVVTGEPVTYEPPLRGDGVFRHGMGRATRPTSSSTAHANKLRLLGEDGS